MAELLADDQQMVDTFSAAALDRDVDEALARLEQLVAEMPVTVAMAGYLAAQYRRNWAFADLSGALARLGLPSDVRNSSTDTRPLHEYVTTVATRLAQQRIDTDRAEGETR